MHITINPTPADTWLVPLVQTDSLAIELDDIANEAGLPAEQLKQDFKGDIKEALPLYGPNGQKIYLLGLGKSPETMDWLKTFREFFFRNKAKLPARISINLTGLGSDVVEAVILGVWAGGYDLRLYQTDKGEAPVFYSEAGTLGIHVGASAGAAAQAAVDRAEAIAQTRHEILDLMNAPANYKNPQTLADWALASGQKHGYAVTVFDKAAIEQHGMQALLSVNKGSDLPPAFIIMEYKPADADNVRTVGLVGKGITFDTGGISIKPSTNMHLMKSDMGGAAAVLGTVEVAAKLKLPVHLIGIIPTTENMVDGSAMKPGDVIGSYIGKTIEVIDTDAEGRLILADGIGYMVRNFKPDVLIDLATLTGSVIGTLGYHAAGMFTQNDTLAAELTQAANRTGERVWRLPLWDVYKEDIKSDVADLRNYSGKPFAGAISAAKFLEVFTEGHTAWAHLDIAGTAFSDNEFGTQKNASGYGIRLLIDWLQGVTG
ncbi:leucyl aminopeptidase family protein [Arsenicibacter rosenii]|uniref:Probable cytosol aminopeptidase n=1 Tax=Arsenicibacter rosenii TaxID=1750698 RepID=A0A1S2VP29_9BACT|nr:leucyl aminopeptidase [Arsenicibacter rosenii]OIN60519.1 leucyl aminopeptidase [Arsenicibacter rosenii]